MKRFLFFLLLCCLSNFGVAAPAKNTVPKALVAQVKRLVELHRDAYAVGYPEATQVQMVDIGKGRRFALALFTIEGFGGGNNHSQYFAVFEIDTAEDNSRHYMLLDVVRIAGKGWRGVNDLKAKVSTIKGDGKIVFEIPALENTDQDAANFPSKKTTIRMVLSNDRLSEQP